MAGIIDFYAESNQSGLVVLGSGAINGAGQAFNAPEDGDANYVDFMLKKSGGPSGAMFARIATVIGTVGTDAVPLTTLGTSKNIIDASTLTTDFQTIRFDFIPVVPIASGTDYAVYIEYDGGTPTDVVHVGSDDSAPTHPGNFATRIDAGSYVGTWVGGSSEDLVFEFGFFLKPAGVHTTFVLPDGRRIYGDEAKARAEYARLMKQEAAIRARIESEKREAERLLAIELAKPRLPDKSWKLSPRPKIEPPQNPAKSRTGLLDAVNQPRLYKD